MNPKGKLLQWLAMETVDNYFLNECLSFNNQKPKFHRSNKEKCGKAALKFRVHG